MISFANEATKLLHWIIDFVLNLAVNFGVPQLINAGVFYGIAGVVIMMAYGVVLFRNIVHSALCLTASFIALGCMYIFLSADFLGAVEIMVYGGAVAIIIVMGIMLIRREDMSHSNPGRGVVAHIAAGVVSALFFISMAAAVIMSPFGAPAEYKLSDSVTGLADLMLTKYIVPFEVAAILLLMAMVGAIIVAKGREADEA
ncbi:MAG: NADH-quinone oxidoreductase subunit J [Selenomonadaceae bacterium]|nr:NADH-quinone oxidoreductase subunit J [Selenomonadaceae bacterium]